MSDDHDEGGSGIEGRRDVGESSDALKRSDPGLFVVTVKRKSRTRVVPSANSSSSAQGRSDVKESGKGEEYSSKADTNTSVRKG
jgi:hypothetical protein